MKPDLKKAFEARYQQAPLVVFAPGRVNLIGDHIDYCGGTVLPMPIEQGTLVAAARNDQNLIRALSHNQPDELSFHPDDAPDFPAGHWGRFLLGAHRVMKERKSGLAGIDLLVSGNIPSGGLSSSASLTIALLSALRTLYQIDLSPMDMALSAQRVEHEFVGVNCGLMDQAVITLGVPDSALLFDCATLEHQSVPIDGSAVSILVADSGVPRTLAGSAYNERRASLAEVARLLELAEDDLARSLTPDARLNDSLLCARARHIASEQQRVMAAVAAIRMRDWPALGALLNDSHRSLAMDYEVSCPELDALAQAFAAQPGCFGARMTGAGFGGAVVALVDTAAEDACIAAVTERYQAQTSHRCSIFRAHSSGGVRLVG